MSVNYVNETSKGLSYSRIQKLSCPRMFQIKTILGYNKNVEMPHFSHGHFVGAGVQNYFLMREKYPKLSEKEQNQRALIEAIKFWEWKDYIPDEKELKKGRTFYHGVRAWIGFIQEMQNPNSSFYNEYKDYRLAKVKDRHGNILYGVELEFLINLPNGYTYEGHVDLILQHKYTGELIVIELKTTSNNILHPAQYKNSLQALGYTIVCDQIALDQNINTARHVDYFVWKNKDMVWNRFRFPKKLRDRADFLMTLKTYTEKIELMKENDNFPRNGDHCFDYYRPCDVYEICDADDDLIRRLARKQEYHKEREDDMAFIFDFEEVIKNQISLSHKREGVIASDANVGDGDIISLD